MAGGAEYDAIIVGAGPAGCAAAIGLAREGLSVLVLEAGAFPGAENWSGCVYFSEALAEPELLGPDGVEALAWERRLVERGFFLLNGGSLAGFTYRSETAFRNCHTVLRPVFDHSLALAAQQHGAALRCRTTVEGLIREGARVIGVSTAAGPFYADLVFLAEGDAAHLVAKEGYEAPTADGKRFLQGIKEVIPLPAEEIRARFDLEGDEGAAYEVLLRNARLGGREARLNMGAFLYTNADTVSLGVVLPLENLAREFSGDHNQLMEWLKSLPEIRAWVGDAPAATYGAKIIQAGGPRRVTTWVDHGLAIGGAAAGLGVDFPFPNYTGPACASGLQLARAVRAARGDYSREALERHYARPLRETRYCRDAEWLHGWPEYVSRTRFFFGPFVDFAADALGALGDQERPEGERVRLVGQLLRRSAEETGAGPPLRVLRREFERLGSAVPLKSALDRRLRLFHPWAREKATAPEGRLAFHYRVGGKSAPLPTPHALRGLLPRLLPGLEAAAGHVYANDGLPFEEKFRRANDAVLDRLRPLDWLSLGRLAFGIARGFRSGSSQSTASESAAGRSASLNSQLPTPNSQLQTIDVKLNTLRYEPSPGTHIKVLWPEDLADRAEAAGSPLWHVCPAAVYQTQEAADGRLRPVVHPENCVKCESCWRAADGVDWGRPTRHGLAYLPPTAAREKLWLQARERLPAPGIPRAGGWWERLAPAGEASAEARRLLVTLEGALVRFEAAVADDQRVLDRGQRGWLRHLAAYPRRAAEELARALPPEARAQPAGQDLQRCLEAVTRHAENDRLFWAEADARQARLHFLPGLRRLLGLPAGRSPREESEENPWLGELRVGNWELGEPDRKSQVRTPNSELLTPNSLRKRLETLFDRRACLALDAGEPLTEEQRAVLVDAARAALAGEGPAGQRAAVLRELGRADAALAWAVVEHLRAVDRLAASRDPEARKWAERLRRAELLATVAEGEPAHPPAGDEVSPRVHRALADVVLIPGGTRDALYRADAGGLRWEAVETTGLRAAGPARLFLQGAVPEGSFPAPDAERGAELPLRAARDLVAVGLGLADRLQERAVEQVRNRIQFPGLFQDEEGRDGIAKFGSMKQLIAESDAHRSLLETLLAVDETLAPLRELGVRSSEFGEPDPKSEVPTPHSPLPTPHSAAAYAAKLLASEALASDMGTVAYNAWQVFGGMSYTAEDLIGKYYRDACEFRFLLAPDVQLKQALGERLAAAGELQLLTLDDRHWLEAARAFSNRSEALKSAVQDLQTAAERLAQTAAGSEPLELAGSALAVLRARAAVLRAHARLAAGRDVAQEAELARLEAAAALRQVLGRTHRLARARLAAELGAELLSLPPEEREWPSVFGRPPVEAAGRPYDAFRNAADWRYTFGDFLRRPFDPRAPALTPELLLADERLRAHWERLRGEFHRRYRERLWDDLPYPRYLAKTHRLPQEDLDWFHEQGFFRATIPAELDGLDWLRAEYNALTYFAGRYGDMALMLSVQVNNTLGNVPFQVGLYQLAAARRQADDPELERRERAARLHLRLLARGFMPVFGLTEPGAGSDTARIATRGDLHRAEVETDADGVHSFQWRGKQCVLLDADRLAFAGDTLCYRWADDAEPSPIDTSGYDYETDTGSRAYQHGERRVEFHDVAQLRREGDRLFYEFYELSGSKLWITNARWSKVLVIYARAEEGLTAFAADRHAEGLVVNRDEPKVGQFGSVTNPISLDRVRVPRENILGLPGQGQRNALETLNVGRSGISLCCVTLMEQCLEEARRMARAGSGELAPGGEALFGEAAALLFACEALTWELVGMLDHPNCGPARMESAIGKFFSSEALQEVLTAAETLAGPAAHLAPNDLARKRADCRIIPVYEGTNQVQRFAILRDLLGEVLRKAEDGETQSGRDGEGAVAAGSQLPAPNSQLPTPTSPLERVKRELLARARRAQERFGDAAWQNGNLQTVFFPLAEIAAGVKVAEAGLRRAAWVEENVGKDAPYTRRARLAAELFRERALASGLELLARHDTAFEEAARGLYPPEVRAGDLALRAAERPAPVEGPEPDRVVGVASPAAVAVLAWPAPVLSAVPLLRDGQLREPFHDWPAEDRAALAAAARLKRAAPERVRLTLLLPAAGNWEAAAREAQALGFEEVVPLPLAADGAAPEPEALAARAAEEARARGAALLFCAAERPEPGSRALPPLLAGHLDADLLEAVAELVLASATPLPLGEGPGEGSGLRLAARAAAGWLKWNVPAVLAFQAGEVSPEELLTSSGWRLALGKPLPEPAGEALPTSGRYRVPERAAPAPAAPADEEPTPERAAALVRDLLGLGSGSPTPHSPLSTLHSGVFAGWPEEQAVVFVTAAGEELRRADLEAAEGAARLAAALGLPFQALLLSPGEPGELAAPLFNLGARRVARAWSPDLPEGFPRERLRGYLPAALRGLFPDPGAAPRWLLGSAELTAALARAVPTLSGPGCRVAAEVSGLSVENGSALVSLSAFGGKLRQRRPLPRSGGWRVVTLAPGASVCGGEIAPPEPHPEPRLETLELDLPAPPEEAAAAVGANDLTQAECIIDVGYALRSRDDLERVVKPLEDCLRALGARDVRVGGTRKVTEELRLLPLERQIGQTGVRVNPVVLLALGVSGAPQHVDYIGERATVISFNRDPEAPLMTLNQRRPAPRVYPVLGDLFETVPLFIEALRPEKERG